MRGRGVCNQQAYFYEITPKIVIVLPKCFLVDPITGLVWDFLQNMNKQMKPVQTRTIQDHKSYQTPSRQRIKPQSQSQLVFDDWKACSHPSSPNKRLLHQTHQTNSPCLKGRRFFFFFPKTPRWLWVKTLAARVQTQFKPLKYRLQ